MVQIKKGKRLFSLHFGHKDTGSWGLYSSYLKLRILVSLMAPILYTLYLILLKDMLSCAITAHTCCFVLLHLDS